MAKAADVYPKFCTGCGQALERKVLKTLDKYDGQTGAQVTIDIVQLACPDYPEIPMHTEFYDEGVSPVTGVKHDRFMYELKR